MRRTSTPRAARKPVRLSNRSSAGAERELGVGGERAQLGRGLVGIAGDGEEALDQRARLARQRGAGAERRLFEEAVGDLADRAAADRVDAGDRQAGR